MTNAPSMLRGDVRALVLRMALPSMGAMIASGLCSLLDALLLARLGTPVAAAVAAALPVLTLIQTIGFTLGMGAGSFVGRSLGSGFRKAALEAASTAFYIGLLLSLFLCALGFVFATPLAQLLGAQGESAAPAVRYIRFVLLCGPLLCMNLMLSSLLRALGQTASNLAAYGVGAIVGSALQFLLIALMGYGVTGSGVAMLVRESVTLIILFYYMVRRARRFLPRIGLITLTRACLKDIMRSGLPTLLRQGLMSVSAALLSRTSSQFGPQALAGMGLCARITTLVASAIIGFGQGFAPICAFAFGAKDMQRVQKAYRFCLRCMVIALVVLGAAVFVFAAPLLALFGMEPAVASFAARALRAQSLVFFAQGVIILMNMLTQALGLTMRASIIATSRQGFVLIPLLLVLPLVFGETGLILCQTASDLISLMLCLWLTRRCFVQDVTRSACGLCGYSHAPTASR